MIVVSSNLSRYSSTPSTPARSLESKYPQIQQNACSSGSFLPDRGLELFKYSSSVQGYLKRIYSYRNSETSSSLWQSSAISAYRTRVHSNSTHHRRQITALRAL